MSSVTEAPRWRHAGSVTRLEPRLALRGSARLELVSADATRLEFAGRQAPLAPLFLSPLLLVLGSLPWLAPRPLDALRATTSALCLAAASGLAAWAWPRRQRLQIAARGRSSADRRVVQPDKLRWLVDTEPTPNAPSVAYTVSLAADDGGVYTVLRNPDPGRLLWQLSEVLRHWPAPVECRWGLPESARPWNIEAQSGPRTLSHAARPGSVSVPLAHRPLIWCAWIMAALVVTDLIFLVTSARPTVTLLHPLSLVLPVLLASYLIALALGLASGRSSLLISESVRREISIFGLRRTRGEVRLESVRGVYAVGGTSADGWHLLVDSADGPLSLAVPRRNAEVLASEAERAIFGTRSPR